MDDCKQRERRQVPLTEVAGGIRGSLEIGDALRLDGISGMTTLKRAKLVRVRRERGRIEAKHGKDDPRVQGLDRQMAAEHRLLVQSRAERDRVTAPVVERSGKGWTLHGHVRDADGHPLAGHRVGLFRERSAEPPELAGATTDEAGYFRISPDPKELRAVAAGHDPTERSAEHLEEFRDKPSDGAGAEAAADDGVQPGAPGVIVVEGKQPQPLTIAVRDRTGRLVHRECQGVTPRAGGVVYRAIVVQQVAREDPGNLPTRFLGNSNSREMHDLRNRQPACNVASIQPANRVFLAAEKEGVAAGFDYCAHCFGPERSRR